MLCESDDMEFSRNTGTGILRSVVLVVAILLAHSGCQTKHHRIATARAPAVVTRFTANPLIQNCDGAMLMPTSGVPHLKVGLAMQSAETPTHVQFAGRLGTALIRDLQLSPGSFSVQPLASLNARAEIPALERHTESGIITVSFQEPADILPPEDFPLSLQLPPEQPLVDQILIVRVIEYRPYFPMMATLEIKVLDSESQEAVFSTTASWTASDYGLLDPRPPRTWFHRMFREVPRSDPSPGHNSPEALMREIAMDVSAWYNVSVNPVVL